MSTKVYLLDGRDVYKYNWHEYESMEALLLARLDFTQDDWNACKVIEGKQIKIGVRPVVQAGEIE